MKFAFLRSKTKIVKILLVLLLVFLALFAESRHRDSERKVEALRGETDPDVQAILDNEISIYIGEKTSIVLFSEILVPGCPTKDPMAMMFVTGVEEPIYGCWHFHKGAILVMWSPNTITFHWARDFNPYTLPKDIPDPQEMPKVKPLSGIIAFS